MPDPSDRKEPALPSAIAHAAACYQEGRLAEAAEACAAYLATRPNHFDALHLAGVIKIAQGDPAGAVSLLTAAVKIRPRSPEAALNLGVALQDLGDANGALVQSDRALALLPSFAEAHNNRGNALRALGHPAEAVASYDRALALRFDYPDALNNRGAALIDLGRAEEAIASCTQALEWRPDFAEAHFNCGNAFRALGRYARALESYREALRCRPGYREALANQVAIFTALNRHEEALAAARAALARDPTHVETLINCGVAFQKLGRSEEALTVYEEALAAAPKHVVALRNRAALLRDFGLHVAALAGFERLLEILPDDGGVLGHAAFAALNLCDWEKAEEYAPKIVRRVAAGDVVAPFELFHLTDEPRLHAVGAANYAKHEIARAPPPAFPAAAPEGITRIAYLSADFGNHPVAHLIADVIERHDRNRFEVHGVCLGSDDHSEVRERLVQAFDGFHLVRGESDGEAARRIRALGIDIAIDLNGYTRNCRPGILAARAAPIQVNYLGYAGTMGADFIDYIVADAVALPLDEAPFVTEKIVHLPDSFMPCDTTHEIAEQVPSREQEGLPASGFVFCCFNNLVKIQRPTFELWMRLLAGVPESVLWLRRGKAEACERLRREAQARLIDPARLVFAERVPHPEHLARHRLADLFLDTLPYNAHATASDALWSGLPVLTCRGRAFPGRVGASLLGAAGLGELIADDLAGYEALALRLAKEPEFLAGLRDRLGENRATAPLFSPDRFCRHLDEAYARMQEMRRAGEKPASFAVAAQ